MGERASDMARERERKKKRGGGMTKRGKLKARESFKGKEKS